MPQGPFPTPSWLWRFPPAHWRKTRTWPWICLFPYRSKIRNLVQRKRSRPCCQNPFRNPLEKRRWNQSEKRHVASIHYNANSSVPLYFIGQRIPVVFMMIVIEQATDDDDAAQHLGHSRGLVEDHHGQRRRGHNLRCLPGGNI